MLCFDFIPFVCSELGTYLCQVNLTEMIQSYWLLITLINTMRHIFQESMTDDSVMVLFQRVPSGMGYLSLTAKGKVSIGIPTEYRLTEYRLIFIGIGVETP